MKVTKQNGWVYYYIEGEDIILDKEKTGKWMYQFDNVKKVSQLCAHAIAEGIVQMAKHNDALGGFACFYLNYDDVENHKKIISFFLEHDMIRKTEAGKLFNISFKLDSQTRAGQYGDNFHAFLRLDNFIDLYTGEWLKPIPPIPKPPTYESKVIKKVVIETNSVINGQGMEYEPKENEEFVQRITVSKSGMIHFNVYYMKENWVRCSMRKAKIKICPEHVLEIFDIIEKLADGPKPLMDKDIIGFWRVDITYEDNGVKRLFGSLTGDCEIDGINMSEYIRERIPIKDMRLFDRPKDIGEKAKENQLRVKEKK